MTIKQTGGIFGRNPTYNDVTIQDLTVSGSTYLSLPVGIGGTANYDMTLSDTAGSAIFNIKSNPASYAAVFFGDSDIPNIGRLIYQNSTNSFQFWTGGSQKIEINALGNLKFTNSGNGIDFSATSGTGTSELFDDYEEGTWTPAGNGITYASGTVGNYTRVGNLVACTFNIVFPTTSDSSVARITGLPFASANSSAATFSQYSDGFNGFLQATNAYIAFINTTGTAFILNSALSGQTMSGSILYQA